MFNLNTRENQEIKRLEPEASYYIFIVLRYKSIIRKIIKFLYYNSKRIKGSINLLLYRYESVYEKFYKYEI